MNRTYVETEGDAALEIIKDIARESMAVQIEYDADTDRWTVYEMVSPDVSARGSEAPTLERALWNFGTHPTVTAQ